MESRPLEIIADALLRWPFARQVARTEPGGEAVSERTRRLRSRLPVAAPVPSICPYCAVGCGTRVHVEDGAVVDVDGDPASPINDGTLCPKGADIFQYAVNPHRLTKALYRRPYGTGWEEVELEWAMDRIAERIRGTRERTWVASDEAGRRVAHTTGVGFLGGAALDNEENYLIKKLCVGLGIVFVENQARI